MEVTADLKENILRPTQPIENIEVVYKKKKKHNGPLSRVNELPFEIKIIDTSEKDDPAHSINFELAQQITLKFSDDSIKVYQDAFAK